MVNNEILGEIDNTGNSLKINIDTIETTSEIISKCVINKLLSYVDFEIKSRHIGAQISNYCFEDAKKVLDDMIKEEFISFDKDEFKPIGTFLTDTRIFYNNVYYGNNDWTGIIEPKPDRVDRNSGTSIKMGKNIEEKSKIEEETKNTIGNESNTNLQRRPRGDTVVKPKIVLKEPDPQKNKVLGKKTIKPEDYQDRIKDLDFDDLLIFNETDTIKKIRREMEEELKKNEEVVTQKKKIEIDLQEKLSEQIRKQKEYDRKNVTADYQGNVIMIKGTTSDKLGTDFLLPKSILRDVSIPEPQRIESPLKMHKGTLKMNIPVIVGRQEEKNKTMTRRKSLVNEKQQVKESKVVQPAGSNFDYINAETGVTIEENGKIKTGNKDFSAFFGKPSKNDYLSLSKDKSNPQANSTNFAFGTNKIDDFRSSMQQLKLPKLPVHGSQIKRDERIMNTTQVEALRVNKKISGSIKNVLDSLDLIEEYDENDLKNNKNLDIFRKKTRMEIEKEMEMKRKNSVYLEEINKFNFNILKNSSWGNGMAQKIKNETSKYHYKPNLRELEREIGKQIVNRKLPRERIKHINMTDPNF